MPEGITSGEGLQETERDQVDEATTDNGIVETDTEGTRDTSATDTATEVDSGPANETARQTVERILKKTKEGTDPKAETKPEGKEGEKKPEEKPVDDAEFDPELTPPERFNAADKQLFNNLPKGLKRRLSRTVKDLEGMATRAVQEYKQAAGEASAVAGSARSYLMQHPDLVEAGYTERKLVDELLAAHMKLSNPQTQRKAYANIGRDLGLPPELIAQIEGAQAGASTPQQIDISNHPAYQAMQREVAELKSWVVPQREQQQTATVNSIVSEMEAVRNEKDQASGQYRFPELHDDAFIERVKPLVSDLVGNTPGLTYGEALRRAYFAVTGKYSGASTQAVQTRLPAANTQTQSRATTAAVSVRGRSAPSASGTSSEIPPEALGSARDSVRWALQQLRRG